MSRKTYLEDEEKVLFFFFLALDCLLSLCISSRYAPLRFGGQSCLAQHHHVIFGCVERLVDPVQAAGHVAGVAGDQHQVADRQQERGSPEKQRQTLLFFPPLLASIHRAHLLLHY